MSDCDKNCESVANLNDYAANLIEYSKRIDRWVNGSQTEFVDVGGVSTPTLRNLAMSIKALMGVHPDNDTIFINQNKEIYVKLSALFEAGGGLAIGQNGRLIVDFSQMPTDKFEALLRQIRVPIWLSGNTNFYVNQAHANASDELDDGRGLSVSKPFKTIQPCINYVTNNYNMINFQANICISPGTYQDNLTLGAFSRTSGSIWLFPYPYPGSIGQVKIKMSGGTGIYCTGGPYYLAGLDLSMRPIYADTFVRDYLSLCNIQEGSKIYFRACAFDMSDLSGLSPGARAYMRVLFGLGGYYSLLPSISGERKMSFKYAKFEENESSVLHGELGTTIEMPATNLGPSYADILCEGQTPRFLYLSDSSLYRFGSAEYKATFSVPAGKSATGSRYVCVNGARCGVLGAGPDFFPGNEAGYVESDTYAWYK